MSLSKKIIKSIIHAQINEKTEHEAYSRLANWTKKPGDKKLFREMMAKEVKHYNFWKKISGQDTEPNKLKAAFYFYAARYLGTNFGIQFMERSKKHSSDFELELKGSGEKNIVKIIESEERDEKRILEKIDKSELAYTSSIILGLNDALVELTGALAGFTLALQNPKVVALAGFITGVAASFSMAASEYLSTKEEGGKNPLTASIYTGFTYLFTVIFLITPFFLLSNPLMSLGITLGISVFLISVFNFYISVAKNLSFSKRAGEMIAISLGVAALNFVIGFAAKKFLKLEI